MWMDSLCLAKSGHIAWERDETRYSANINDSVINR
jgi:hypothetical protein